MGRTADLTVVQKTIIDILHKEGKPQTFIAKEAGCSQSAVSKHFNKKLSERKKEKDAQPTRTAALRGLSSKIDSRIWVNFTRNGLRLGSRHQEPPHTDVSRNLKELSYSSC
ncbi:Pantothenate kinase 1 [Labeo rohita]|uniref:Pantothenate kinase 1 n=1 Tax=Labeo rohita TaxID=84645 RepID=A0ABQ8LT31_LABRO|nr:Pantothenate kinase 1 [Labeo rohita]